MPQIPASPGAPEPIGRLTAGEIGALTGVSGTTIGQWARRGAIRASQSAGEPHVYSVQDAAEAAVVGALLGRGVRHAAIRAAVGHLGPYGPWPLSTALLATTRPGRPPGIAVHEEGQWLVLGPRGWQAIADGMTLRELHVRFRPAPSR